jgi:hypothetical protein
MDLSLRNHGHWIGLWNHGFLHSIPDMAWHLGFAGAARFHGPGSLAITLAGINLSSIFR